MGPEALFGVFTAIAIVILLSAALFCARKYSTWRLCALIERQRKAVLKAMYDARHSCTMLRCASGPLEEAWRLYQKAAAPGKGDVGRLLTQWTVNKSAVLQALGDLNVQLMELYGVVVLLVFETKKLNSKTPRAQAKLAEASEIIQIGERSLQEFSSTLLRKQELLAAIKVTTLDPTGRLEQQLGRSWLQECVHSYPALEGSWVSAALVLCALRSCR